MMTKAAVAVFFLAAVINAALEISGVVPHAPDYSIEWGFPQ